MLIWNASKRRDGEAAKPGIHREAQRLTGRHVTTGGEEVYGLVCVCLQTYNTRIYGIQNRKLESISLAIEVLIQEVGPPDFIACDREGAFQ